MAISQTVALQRCEVYPAQAAPEPGPEPDPPEPTPTYCTLMVVCNLTFDDPSDDYLPTTATDVKHFTYGDGQDISKMPEPVPTIAAAIWPSE